MSDNPTKPFNDAVRNISREKEPEQPPKIRDKDNADHRHPPPRLTPFSERNRAPKGMSGIKRNLPSPIRPSKVLSVDIRKGDPEQHLYIDGKITSLKGYSFIVKVHDKVHRHGIDGGTIEKLDIRKGGVSVARYDRGWDVKPQTARDAEAVRKVEDAFNGKSREFKPIVTKNSNKDRGHER